MRRVLSALTIPTGLALLILPVQPQDAPSSSSISSSSMMGPGQQMIVTSEGAPPGATVMITLDRSPRSTPGADHRVVLGRATAAADGSFRSSVSIPPGTPPGVYSLVSATGSRQLGTVALRVRTTGARAVDVLPGLLTGAGLIVAGGLLLLGVQYRRSQTA
jgi:hypothetical protein